MHDRLSGEKTYQELKLTVPAVMPLLVGESQSGENLPGIETARPTPRDRLGGAAGSQSWENLPGIETGAGFGTASTLRGRLSGEKPTRN